MSAPPPVGRSGPGTIKIRLTILCAKNLSKREFFRLPDPFAKICVEGSGQCYTTETCKASLDPKWNQHYDLFIGKKDAINISVWDKRKISKKVNSCFLGCVKMSPNQIHRLKDTGYQRLELSRLEHDECEAIKGQIVLSLMSRDGRGFGSHNAIVDTHGNLSSPDDLPTGWEERRTEAGRLYYVNHRSRTTHWDRPPQGPDASADNADDNVISAANEGNIVLTNPSATPLQEDQAPITGNKPEPTSCVLENQNAMNQRASRRSGEPSRRRSARHQQYLARNQLHQSIALPQGYEMRTTQQGQVYYYNLSSGTSTWHDPRVPKDIGVINPEDLGQLPPGWELRHLPNSRPYFLDHMRRTTQFTDPRLSNLNVLNSILHRSKNTDDVNAADASPPIANGATPAPEPVTLPTLQEESPQRAAAPASNRNKPSNRTAVAPDSNHTSARLSPPAASTVSSGTRETLGATVLQNEVSRLSVKAEESLDCLPKYSRDLVAKLKVLRTELQYLQPPSGHCRLDIPRQEIFEESFKQVMKLRAKDLKKRLLVKFRSEEGLDYGGIAREWLYLLSHEMLNPYYGLFQYSREDIYTLQVNPDSQIVSQEHLSYFHFVGRVMGVAVFHGHYIDGGFTMPFYKMLLNKPIVLDDIEDVDPELHRSLNWILDNDITDVIDTSFSVQHDSYGKLHLKELKPGGANVNVTEENKKEYVRLYVQHRFMRGIEKQFAALHKGFTDLVPAQLLAAFDERELELIIGGLGTIDIDDWKKNTRLKHCTTETPVYVWFWQIVDSYSEEMRARLLQFVTGSSRIPLQGFKGLHGSTGAAGPRLFTIHVLDASTNNLPKAHTCFNRIDIPPYESYEKMQEKLTQAVEETCGFAVE